MSVTMSGWQRNPPQTQNESEDRFMQIVSSASAFPPHYYPQEVLMAALQQYWGDEVANPKFFSGYTGMSAWMGDFLQ